MLCVRPSSVWWSSRPWTSDDRPWTTSMNEFIVPGRLHWPRVISSSMNILYSSGVILGPTCSIGSGRFLWTNRSWTNFPLPYQLPPCSKGRPGYCCDFNKISLFCEPHVAKLLVGQLCRSRFPKKSPRVNFWVASVVSVTLLLGPINSTFSFMPLTFLSFSLLPSRPRASSSSPPGSIRYFLFLFRFSS